MSLDLGVMVDESGSKDSRYYLATLVFHDQEKDVATPIALCEAVLREKGLAAFPSTPLRS